MSSFLIFVQVLILALVPSQYIFEPQPIRGQFSIDHLVYDFLDFDFEGFPKSGTITCTGPLEYINIFDGEGRIGRVERPNARPEITLTLTVVKPVAYVTIGLSGLQGTLHCEWDFTVEPHGPLFLPFLRQSDEAGETAELVGVLPVRREYSFFISARHNLR